MSEPGLFGDRNEDEAIQGLLWEVEMAKPGTKRGIWNLFAGIVSGDRGTQCEFTVTEDTGQ